MKHIDYLRLSALAVALLAIGAVPGSLPGQTAPKPPSPSNQSAPNAADHKCNNLDSLAEQISEAVRNMKLEEKFAGLSDRLAKEEALMSSPEFAKLQNLSAQFAANEGPLEAKAEDMAAKAQELTSELQDKLQNNTNLLVSSDEGSGWLGVEIAEVTPDKAKDLKLSATRGVIVEEVEPDSPAAKAGLKTNDVILRYDDQIVEGTVQFRRLIRETPSGRTVELAISRDGRTQNLSVELADRSAYYEKRMEGRMRDLEKPFAFSTPNLDLRMAGPEAWFMDTRTPILGISAEDLNGQLGAYFGAPGDSGVLVREVRSGTPAEKAGLKAGDVIIKVDGNAVKSLSELRDQLRQKTDQKSVTLSVLRKGSELKVPVEIERPKPLERVETTHRAQL
jgi:serine protease Do